MTRKYEIKYLHPTAGITEISRLAPALPAFEDAFGALGHGAILQTDNGPMCVEDLLPGDRVRLANGDYDTLLWHGAMTLLPDFNSEDISLIRITADALGPQRPAPDLVLGPTARLYHRANGVRTLTGVRGAFIPARDFVDGSQFIALRPVAAVRVYQLGFAEHQRLSVNGIEIESLHPGTAFSLGLRGDTLVQFLSLFPHKRDLEEFGTLNTPRLRLRDLDIFDQ
ncbi:Hint domain-containing protein [Yoonia sp. 2307UL14-13]|uniref:Hint domain-containing protein n=1 Tax=Yoonia sp. 2307UL14-13 TaxID=3126506 RepID=UPI0030AD3447